MLLAWLGRSVLMQSPLGGFLKSLTPRAWLHIGLVAAVVIGFLWHQRHARAEIAAAEKRGEDRAYAAVTEKARKLAQDAAQLSAKIRSLNDATNRRIDADARALLVRGPGKAACTGSIPAAPSGRQPASGPADAPLARVPYPEWQQLIGLPFPDTVEFARLCDANRAEALSWREWHRGIERQGENR